MRVAPTVRGPRSRLRSMASKSPKVKSTQLWRRALGSIQDSGQPVTFDYQPPNRFTGEIEKVVVDLTDQGN
jgi:hypothetical protein